MRSLLPLGVDITGLAMDTAVVAYLLDPSVDRYRISDLAARFLGRHRRRRYRRQGAGSLRPRRGARPARADDGLAEDDLRSARLTAVLARLRPPLADALAAVGEDALYDDIEQPLVRVLARMEVVGHPRRPPRSCGRSPPGWPRSAPRWRLTIQDLAGEPVQGELGPPAAHRALRHAWASRRCARPRPGSRPTPGPSSCCAASTRSSTPCCATARWRSCAPPTARAWPPRWPPTAGSTPPSARRWPAPAGCRRTGPTCTTSRCAPRRAGGSARRSSPPPGAACWWPTTTRSSCGPSPTCPGDPGLTAAFAAGEDIHRIGGLPGLRRRSRRGHPRPALDGQDGLLRPRLRHGGLRSVPAAGCAGRRGAGHPRGLLRRLSLGARVHGPDGVRGPLAGLHRDRLRPPPAPSRPDSHQLPGARRRPSARP